MSQDWWIVRSEDWDEAPISIEEWEAVADRDPDLARKPEREPGGYFFTPVEGSWIDWNGGVIQSKNATRQIRAKMVALATQLNGWVVDDDGERYDADGDVIATRVDQAAPLNPSFIKRLFGPRRDR